LLNGHGVFLKIEAGQWNRTEIAFSPRGSAVRTI
jgi:hypothetical protein